MSGRIEADWMTLMGQADATGSNYFFRALESVRAAKSDNVHARVPQGNATDADVTQAIALARVMAMDFHSSSLSVAADKISDGLTELASAVESLAEFRGGGEEIHVFQGEPTL